MKTHINTISFSAVAAISVDDVFTSTYKDYFVKLVLTATSTIGIRFRMRASGTDATGSNYRNYGVGQNASSTVTGSYGASETIGNLGGAGTTTGLTSFIISSPQLAVTTAISGQHARIERAETFHLLHSVSTAFDGFTLSLSSAGPTMTGSISFYGYED